MAFDALPVEIRHMIYRWSLPRLFHMSDHQIDDHWITGPKTKHQWRRVWTSGIRLTSRNNDMPALDKQLSTAAALMSVSPFVRQEVAQIVYPNVCFRWRSNQRFQDHILHLSPLVKVLLTEACIEVPNRWDGSPQQELLDTLKELKGLQTLHVASCDMTADEEMTGTLWKSYHLQALRAIKKACPQLTNSYHSTMDRPQYKTVISSGSGHAQSSVIQFDIDIEYEKWLRVFRDRRVAREAEEEENLRSPSPTPESEDAGENQDI